jgi:thiamine kinase-like enzyme
MQQWLRHLEGHVFSVESHLRVPAPLGLIEDLHMVVHRYIEGDDLRHVLDADGQSIMLAASWLARLHRSAPLEGLRVRTPEHEIEKAIRWLDDVQAHVSPDACAALEVLREALHDVLADPPAIELRTIHRDYYYANLLWDGERIWAIDLDQLRIGDPALDVAHFLAHLQVLSYRQTGSFEVLAEHGDIFVNTYFNETHRADVEAQLPLYRAYTFLKLAETEAKRQREGWKDVVEALALAASREVDQITRAG